MAAREEYLSLDESIYAINRFKMSVRTALGDTLEGLAERLEKKIKALIGRAVGHHPTDIYGDTSGMFNWPALTAGTIETKERLHLGKDGDPWSMLWGTGEFFSSIRVHVDRKTLKIHMGSGAKYAMYLEFGTANMPPRPVFRPISQLAAQEFAPVFKAAMTRELGHFKGAVMARKRHGTFAYHIDSPFETFRVHERTGAAQAARGDFSRSRELGG